MKRVLFLIAAAMVLFCACDQGEGNNKAATDNNVRVEMKEEESEKAEERANTENVDDWKMLYADFLLELKEYFSSSDNHGYISMIQVNDLNFDGVPELIVSDDGVSAAPTFAIYRIGENRVEKIAGHSAAQKLFEENQTAVDSAEIEPYAFIKDGWLSLKKNEQSGKYMYVFLTGNGAELESFGSVYGTVIDEKTGELSFEELFWSSVLYTENRNGIEKEEYRAYGKEEPKAEYETLFNEFEKEWTDAGYEYPVMGGYAEANYIKMAESKAEFLSFFDMYQPEP